MASDYFSSIAIALKSEDIIRKIGLGKLRKLCQKGPLCGFYKDTYHEGAEKKNYHNYFGVYIYEVCVNGHEAEKLDLDKLKADILEAKNKFEELVGMEGDIYLIGNSIHY